ncbi:MAG: hypothetical protein WD944_03065 [Steroidobacteraceae bacterium]
MSAQQRLAQGDAALHTRERGDEQSFDPHQQQGMRRQRRSIGPSRLDRRHDGINDERADESDGCRKRPGDECQGRNRNAQPPAGRPDELQGAPAVAEDAEKSARQFRCRRRRRIPPGLQSLQGRSGVFAQHHAAEHRDRRPAE